MREQRRHQRVRFNIQPLMRIGQFGVGGTGELENISLGGLMLRTRTAFESRRGFRLRVCRI
jgi:hypothetical protein